MSNPPAPWTTGPAEILRHGLDLLDEDSDRNRRLSMIATDNGVELTIKTYLSLPRRVTGLKISRKDRDAFAESFPALLDALEEHASDKLSGVNLGEIEWYHRLRNQLYHDGNGLTVEKRKAEVYAELASLLFERLFQTKPPAVTRAEQIALRQFLEGWAELEARVISFSEFVADTYGRTPNVVEGSRVLVEEGRMDTQMHNSLVKLMNLRNRVVHAGTAGSDEITEPSMATLRSLLDWIRRVDS